MVPTSGYSKPSGAPDLSRESAFHVVLSTDPKIPNRLFVWLGSNWCEIGTSLEGRALGPGPGVMFVEPEEGSPFDCLVTLTNVELVAANGPDYPASPLKGQLHFGGGARNKLEIYDGVKWTGVEGLTPGTKLKLQSTGDELILQMVDSSGHQSWI